MERRSRNTLIIIIIIIIIWDNPMWTRSLKLLDYIIFFSFVRCKLQSPP